MSGPETERTILGLFLDDAEEAIVREMAARLRVSPSAHYRGMDIIDLQPRMRALFRAYRESVLKRDPEPVSAFVNDIGRKRLQQEYDLDELLLVLNILDAAVWERAAAVFVLRGAEAFDDLRLLAEAVTWAKDSLVRVYAEEKEQERAAFGRLNKAFSDYLKIRYTGEGE
jgi:hypothetical protein